MKKSWTKRVYRPAKKKSAYKDYYELKHHFCRKFKNTCQACRKRFGKITLSLHHIIPVELGGLNDYDNLILLCKHCHNIIDLNINKYKCRSDIEYIFADRKPPKIKEKPIGKDWHSWVYGGAANPMKLIK